MEIHIDPNNYQNLQSFLKAELAARCKKNPAYSLRSFAKSLGIENSALSKILNGKRNISKKMGEKILDKFLLNPKEVAKFLVHLNPDDDSSFEEAKFKAVTLDQFEAISQWYHFALLELVRTKDFEQDEKWISKRLNISVHLVKDALERLIRLGYLKSDRKGKIETNPNYHTTTSNKFTHKAFKSLQSQILKKADEAMEDIPLSIRDQSSMTMAIDSKKFDQAKVMIRDFRRKLNQFLGEDGPTDEVYQLSISLYPVTQQIKNLKGDNSEN